MKRDLKSGDKIILPINNDIWGKIEHLYFSENFGFEPKIIRIKNILLLLHSRTFYELWLLDLIKENIFFLE